MVENGYYPPGAENDPDAPYNQIEQEYVEVSVTISQTLSRSTSIEVNDYTLDSWEEAESDGEGGVSYSSGVEYDFSDSDLQGAYEQQEYSIPDLLEYLKAYLITDIAKYSEENSEKKKLQHILECCEGWEVDETEVIED